MGLDHGLKLTKGHYLFGDDKQGEMQAIADRLVPDKRISDLMDRDFFVADVSIRLCNWRKINAVHGWFVKNVNHKGRDECQDEWVEWSKLHELDALLTKVIALSKDKRRTSHTVASTAHMMMPPASGFFFGSYDIDEWYWHGLQQVKCDVSKILAAEEAIKAGDYYMYYWSSW